MQNSMPSSSAYAAPLSLRLDPSRYEYVALGVGLLVAVAGIFSADLPLMVQAVMALLALSLAMRALQLLQARPGQLMLYADGSLTLSAATAGIDVPIPLPAQLLQAAWWGPLAHLEFSALDGPRHSLALFPDRLDADSRQRLRVWLATHRPVRSAAPVEAPGARA